MIRGQFRLYPTEKAWWSFNDYGTVVDVMARLKPARVLEFGPGSSTLALIEGGAVSIDTCEDDPAWLQTYTERLANKYPSIVRIHQYDVKPRIVIPELAGQRFDLALVDGPLKDTDRPKAVAFALKCCDAVLVPTEDDGRREQSVLRPVLEKMAKRDKRTIEFIESGPLAGGFALLAYRA